MYYIGVCPPMYCIYMFYVYMLVELVSIQQRIKNDEWWLMNDEWLMIDDWLLITKYVVLL